VFRRGEAADQKKRPQLGGGWGRSYSSSKVPAEGDRHDSDVGSQAADPTGRTSSVPRLADGGDGMTDRDRDEIDLALHEIQQMVEVSIRAAERLQGTEEDEMVSQMPRADHELLDFSLFDLARRVKASREMLFVGDKPVTVRPVLSIVRDPA
jgi:hypothetical protein